MVILLGKIGNKHKKYNKIIAKIQDDIPLDLIYNKNNLIIN